MSKVMLITTEDLLVVVTKSPVNTNTLNSVKNANSLWHSKPLHTVTHHRKLRQSTCSVTTKPKLQFCNHEGFWCSPL